MASTAPASSDPPADPPLADRIAGLLRDVPDFPNPGVLFKDIAPLLADGPALADVVAGLAAFARDGAEQPDVDLVAGVEARGFLLAGAIATELGVGVLPVRKVGKLPPPTLSRSYALEYGEATIEVPAGGLTGRRVLLVDDVLATGGTLRAAADLIGDAGGTVAAMAVILELGFLAGREALAGSVPVHALLTV